MAPGNAKSTAKKGKASIEDGARPKATRKKLVKTRAKDEARGVEASDVPSLDENPGMLLSQLVEMPEAARMRPRRQKTATILDEDCDELAVDGGEAMLGAVSRLAQQAPDTPEASSQARAPESEFHVGAAGEIALEDLLAPLAEGVKFGEVRKQLQGIAKKEAMPDPVSEVKRGREDRSAQYENSSRDVAKWIPQVQRMRKAEQVLLEDGQTEDRKITSTAALVGGFKPMDDFERELEEITRSAGATQDDLKHARELPVNPRIRDAQQTQQVARLKALMMREQTAAKRVNKIKSKTYRRIHRRGEAREREVMLQRLEQENPELAKNLKQDYEKQHAQRRLLRQRNARKKWAQTMQRFGKTDAGVRQEISKQATDAREEDQSLKRAIKGQEATDSDDDGDGEVDLSDDEGGVTGSKGLAKQTLRKAKALTVHELKNLVRGDEDLPTKGILGMNFMRNAIKQKREEAQQSAKEVLMELEGLDMSLTSAPADDYSPIAPADAIDENVSADTNRNFTPEELADARKEVDDMFEQEDNARECTVSGPLTVKGVAAKQQESKLQSSAAAFEATSVASSVPKSRKSKPAKSSQSVAPNPWLQDQQDVAVEAPETGKISGKGKKRNRAGKKDDTSDKNKATADEVLSALCEDTDAAKEQRDLVRTAFVEGTQEDDFDAEILEKGKAKEAEQQAKDDRLMGWGSWTGEGIKRRPRRRPVEIASAVPTGSKSRVQFHEGNTLVKSGKYFVDQVPFPFQTAEQYNQQLNMPTGPEWNTLSGHLDKIKPKFFSKIGAVVAPLKYIKHLPQEQRDTAMNTWAAAKQPKRLKARF